MNRGSLKRPNFYAGMMFTEDDLREEQQYHIAKRNLLNRCLYGCRIACGLEVRLCDDVIHIEPGMALDCCGREIYVPEPTKVEIPPLDESSYLLLQYKEKQSNPVPVPSAAGHDDELQYTRTIESFQLVWGSDNPIAQHERRDTYWICCEQDHPIPLARIIVTRDGLMMDDKFATTIQGCESS